MGIYAELSQQLKNTHATLQMGDTYSLWFKKDGSWKSEPNTTTTHAVLAQIGKEVERDYQTIDRIQLKIRKYLRQRKI